MGRSVIVVAGPTASGKTALGIELARALGGEIVSADSMQVYRRMDIGTAKASAEEQTLAPHHMLDVAEPWEDYSVSRYVDAAALCCEEIMSRGRLPIIVGGTGLYIDSLLSGRDFAARDEGDEKLRARLGAEYDQIGGEAMLQKLRGFDEARAEKLHPSDKRRIVRAMEIFMLTGITATEHDRRTQALPPRYEAARIVLGYDRREELYRRIDRRVDSMVADGLFDEVAGLLTEGIPPDCTAMQAIGYKEAAAALKGDCSTEEAVAAIKQNSRRYSKRQITWFRRWEDALRINWNPLPDFERARRLSTEFLHSRGIS